MANPSPGVTQYTSRTTDLIFALNLVFRGKMRLGKNKRHPTDDKTDVIVTFEDLFTFFGDSRQHVKEKRKTSVNFSDDNADADAGINVDDDTDGSDEDDYDVRLDDSCCRSQSSDNVSQSSRSSYSTMATMDDNIGAGRTLDNYFYQPAGRFVEHAFITMASFLQGGSGRVPLLVPVSGNDSASVLTGSSTSTISNNPGPGRIIDKYIYQMLGRMLERCAGRIAMSHFIWATVIRQRIEEVWYDVEIKEPCFVCRQPDVASMSAAQKIRMAISRIEDAPSGMFILSGLKEITKRLR